MTAPSVKQAPAVPLLQLLEERRLGDFFSRAAEKPSVIFELLKEAGLAGVVAYFIAFIIFYSFAGSAGEVIYHSVSGQWLDPRVLLMEDGAAGKAESLAIFASFYLACKPFAPLRLGGALILTPDVNRFIEARPAVAAAANTMERFWDGPAGAAYRAIAAAIAPLAAAIEESAIVAPLRREFLKSELLELASLASGGLTPLEAEAQSRLEEIALAGLPGLSSASDPARSAASTSAEWECRWTNEELLTLARSSALLGRFGLRWERTYQSVDLEEGALASILQYNEGTLTLNATIAPGEAGEADSSKFSITPTGCVLRWRSYEIPLPPVVGLGRGEVVFWDDELLIQHTVGGLTVATRV